MRVIKMRIDPKKKESFSAAWRYHRSEAAVCAFGAVIYILFMKNTEPNMPAARVYSITIIFSVVVILRILYSGFTGRFSNNTSSDDRED